jgi:hypothetical protein
MWLVMVARIIWLLDRSPHSAAKVESIQYGPVKAPRLRWAGTTAKFLPNVNLEARADALQMSHYAICAPPQTAMVSVAASP